MSRVVARWSFNAKFGKTQEASTSIKNWCKTVGCTAWTDMKWSRTEIANRVTLQQGSIGTSEQKFEMRVEFDSLSDLDRFFGAIPGADHVAWGKQHAELIEGNTQWEIYRTKPMDFTE
eukprot:32430_1